MAVDPKAVTRTLTYPGGHVTATMGLLEFIFGASTPTWLSSSLPPAPGQSTRRRKYGTRQRSQAIGGKVVYLKLSTGDVWTVRVGGAVMDFIDYVLANTAPGVVLNVWTQRGTEYGPQAVNL